MTRFEDMDRAYLEITEARFWAKVNKNGHPLGCWEWTGGQGGSGGLTYGRYLFRGKIRPTHRIAYEFLVGPIPEGLTIDHLCRNPLCVNPSHLEPVTQRENTLRGTSPIAQFARATHCKRGHEFTPENTYRTPRGRHCKECQRGRVRAYKARKRDEKRVAA